MRRVRTNPDLIVLMNPIAERPPRVAPADWARFHYPNARDPMRRADEADWIRLPDNEHLPKVVWALGWFNGGTFVGERGGETEVRFATNRQNGPWLVSAPGDPKSLWILARRASQLARLSRYHGRFMSDVYYTPSPTSGKYDKHRGYRHEWGEGGSLPKRRWEEARPMLDRVSPTLYEIVGPVRSGFRVEPRGIVG